MFVQKQHFIASRLVCWGHQNARGSTASPTQIHQDGWRQKAKLQSRGTVTQCGLSPATLAGCVTCIREAVAFRPPGGKSKTVSASSVCTRPDFAFKTQLSKVSWPLRTSIRSIAGHCHHVGRGGARQVSSKTSVMCRGDTIAWKEELKVRSNKTEPFKRVSSRGKRCLRQISNLYPEGNQGQTQPSGVRRTHTT
ncbi:hypothetical protein LZ30DRAFT_154457 [Colletotrichum cereale]|nr:hypothetical protein LZ30DRAFT_154457 [Colletotrichum cereale]